jgi:hypothetical protein
MAQMNMIQALNSAMDIMLARDPNVVVLGEDVGFFGGVFRVTDGLQRKYGEHRVLDTPIAEGAIVGAAIGMGVNGMRPIAEVQFADYIYPACDQIFSELARLRYRSAGEFWAPITIRTPCGGGIRGGQTHSQSPEGIFTHVCGIKVVMPSNPYDAKGLLIAAIEDDDPVVFFRAEAALQRPVRRRPEQARGAVEHAREGRCARRLLHRADRPRRDRARGQPAHDRDVRHDGLRLRGRCALARARCRDHRRAFDGAARRGHDLQLGEPHRTLPRRARGDALLGFWRRALGDDPGAVLLGSRGADRARGRLGYALSARVRVGVFSGPEARCDRPREADEVVMSRYVFKMPDLGEGTVEAEVVAWHVKVGDTIQEDQIMAEVMTDKAAVEVPSPVTGKVIALHGAPGEMVPVGAELIVFETDVNAADDAASSPATPGAAPASATPAPAMAASATKTTVIAGVERRRRRDGYRARARRRCVGPCPRVARHASAGARGRHRSSARHRQWPQGTASRARISSPLKRQGTGSAATARSGSAALQPRTGTEEIKVIGLRRLIANRMSEAKRNIPHFAYVEEVDVTELESLRSHLNRQSAKGAPR